MKNFISFIPKTVINCFTPLNLFWQILAGLITYFLVISNIDWYYFVYVRSSVFVYFFFPAVIIGGLFPIAIPIYLIVKGKISKKESTENLGWILGLSAIMGSFISTFYKAFTGRIQPNLYDSVNNISHNFNFGFFKNGIVWGWPSSHTTIAFAMALTLIYLYPKNKIIRFVSILYAFYIGIGVSFSIHWFSEIIAGAILGTIIGISVAKNYKMIKII